MENNTNTPARNYTADILKCIAACMIIFIHIKFPGSFGQAASAAARFAVPLFFMVSGFFCVDADSVRLQHKIYRNAVRIFKIFAAACLLYFIWEAAEPGGLEAYTAKINGIFTPKHFLSLLLINNVQIKYHLWFLPALLYCYIAAAAINRLKLCRAAFVLIPVLLLLNLFPNEFIRLFGITLPPEYTRNFWLTGFPFFMLGKAVRTYGKIPGEKLSCTFLSVCAVFGIFAAAAEQHFAGQCELYAGSVITAVSLILLIRKNPCRKSCAAAAIGSRYSLPIYILHPIIITLFKEAVSAAALADNIIVRYFSPIAVCLLSTALSALLYAAKHKITKRVSPENANLPD